MARGKRQKARHGTWLAVVMDDDDERRATIVGVGGGKRDGQLAPKNKPRQLDGIGDVKERAWWRST